MDLLSVLDKITIPETKNMKMLLRSREQISHSHCYLKHYLQEHFEPAIHLAMAMISAPQLSILDWKTFANHRTWQLAVAVYRFSE